jgi:hypothetical protein
MNINQELSIAQSYEEAGREYASYWPGQDEETVRAAAKQAFDNDPREYEHEDWADYSEGFIASFIIGYNDAKIVV